MRPPKCPKCWAELHEVVEETRSVYVFKEGWYVAVEGEAEMHCPECGEDLYDLFPDGVCNYTP